MAGQDSEHAAALAAMRKVISLEDNPEPGLMTWQMMREDAWIQAFKAIREFIPEKARNS